MWILCVCVCVSVNTGNWMLIFIYKGAYCNFSLWGFYDTVWQMLSCQTGCCVACFILFFGVACPFLNSCVIWSFEKKLCLLRLLQDCDFDWFHSNLSKSPNVYFGLCYNVWAFKFILAFGFTVWRSFLSVHKYCLEIMQFQGLHASRTNIHSCTALLNSIWHYLVVFGTWRLVTPHISLSKR